MDGRRGGRDGGSDVRASLRLGARVAGVVTVLLALAGGLMLREDPRVITSVVLVLVALGAVSLRDQVRDHVVPGGTRVHVG